MAGLARPVPHFEDISRLAPEGADAALAAQDAPAALGLAWCLRQHAPARARQLLNLLDDVSLLPGERARIRLIHAEWAYLGGDLPAALRAMDALAADASLAHEAALQCDMCMLRRSVEMARGNAAQATHCIQRALQWAEAAHDTQRVECATALMAGDLSTANPVACEAQWSTTLARIAGGSNATAAAMARMIQGAQHYLLGRPDQAAFAIAQAFEALVSTGQTINASICASNAASVFDDLQDQDAALEWAQRGLELAREVGFPFTLGLSLFRVAERLRKLDRLDAAQSLLQEAQGLLEPFKEARNYVLILLELGAVAVVQGRLLAAVDHYEQARALAVKQSAPDLLATAWQGLAQTALTAGELTTAEEAAQRTLEAARKLSRPVREAEALMLLARCKSRQGESSAANELIQAALQRDEGRRAVPATWWGELADCLAAQGNFSGAYEARAQADTALRAEGHELAQRHALGLQVRLQTLRLQADADAQRQRAELLQASTHTLVHLGEVGQELTSLLDEDSIYEAILRHVGALLQAEFFAVYLLTPDGLSLERAFAAQGARRFERALLPVDHPRAASAQCHREQRELQIDFDPDDAQHVWIPGSQRSRSALFAPLRAGQRPLGVMSIQAVRADAFGERERQVFRSLCAYASIAIANAQAYRSLRETQRSLARQQRLVAIGAMVAGVAHEMNTPIGNAMLAASTLTQLGGELEQMVLAGAIGRNRLLRFVQEVQEGGALVLRNLERSALLVQSFKQVVQDHRTLRRGRFSLRYEAEAALQGPAERALAAGHRLEIDIPAELQVDGYREAFHDLLRHWIDNAMAHAVTPASACSLRVQGRLQPGGRIELQLSDDGAGMAGDVLERAFEPFFSTRLGAHHSGLGLTIVHSIAVDLFGGDLSLESSPGQGTGLRWVFPCVAPLPAA